MKRILALLLCCVMLIPTLTGCKDEDINQTIELNNTRIAADILEQYESKCTYAYAEGKYTIKDLKITTEVNENDSSKMTCTATVTNAYVEVDLTVAVEYKRENNYWRLHRLGFAKLDATPIAAPNRASLLNTVRNSIHANGSALAKQGTTYHNLMFDVDAVMWDLSFDKVTKTAQLLGSYKSTNLTFMGSYDLTFGENGWIIQAITQDNQTQILMRLQSLETK